MRVYACGSNSNGQLGIGHRDDVSALTECIFSPADALANQRVKSISSGGNHSLILTESGSLYGCGLVASFAGLLHATDDQELPKTLLEWTPLRADMRWEAIACGWDHVVLIEADTGCVYTTGSSNAHGQLGIGRGKPADGLHRMNFGCEQQPRIVSIAAGMRFSIAIDKEGSVWSWGSNRHGQTGHSPADTVVDIPRKCCNSDIPPVSMATCGSYFTALIASDRTRVITFGTAKHGLQRDFTTEDDTDTTATTATTAATATTTTTKFVSITSGWSHAIATDSNGRFYGWGRNNYNQLLSASNEPADLQRLEQLQSMCISTVVCGSEHAVALSRESHAVYAWGWNEHGNCGVGNYTENENENKNENEADNGDNDNSNGSNSSTSIGMPTVMNFADTSNTRSVRMVAAGCGSSFVVSE